MRHFFIGIFALAPALLAAGDPTAAICRAKLNLIKQNKATPGSVFVFPPAEINAWAREELGEEDLGIHDPKLEFGDGGTVTFNATVDLSKIAGKKSDITALFARLLEGQRPVKLTIRPETASGKITLHLISAEIAGIPLSGVILETLAGFVVQHIYEDAKVSEPFDLGHNIDHAIVEPMSLRVFIKK